MVRSLFTLGWLFTAYHLYRLSGEWASRGALTGISFLVFCAFSLVATAVRLIPWYKKQDRGHGIEEHFAKTWVPVAYLLPITNLVYFFVEKSWPFLLLVSFMLLTIQTVNCILIYFHRRDPDLTAPSFFSRQPH